MAKKSKSEATRLDEVDRSVYSTFCSAANSLSQIYTQAMAQQKVSFQAGERHALVCPLLSLPLLLLSLIFFLVFVDLMFLPSIDGVAFLCRVPLMIS